MCALSLRGTFFTWNIQVIHLLALQESLCSSGALTTGKEENIMTIEKTLEAVSEKLKDAPVNTNYADSLLLIKNALEKQRMCEWTKGKNTLGKSACETTALLGKTVWIIMLTNIISQGNPCTI